MSESPEDADQGDGLDALRSLLFQPEKKQLDEIQTRLEDESLRAEDVSEVLAEAFLMRIGRDDKLSRALTPTIEKAIEGSTKRNTRVLVDAISPLMGPAIRRSILQTISGMIQSMNETLDQSFSAQGFKWRWEAVRTGKSFGEVVMLHTLVFQVEQVFLIHKETGLMLQHVSRQAIQGMDADMVSGMLTAIQDFVRDSFGANQEESLQTMQVGELTVWIEEGPDAVLAAVVRGRPPVDLRQVMQEALENIHLELKKAFDDFEGDSVYFEPSRRHLEDCLRSQYRSEVENKKKKISPMMWVGLVGLVGALSFWGYAAYEASSRWQGYISQLKATPGIVVVERGTREGRYFVSGMRDPLSVEPSSFLADHGLSVQEVEGQWATYQSFAPPLVLQRAKKILSPPVEVNLTLQDDVLVVAGTAPRNWIEDTKLLAKVLPGITTIDLTAVEVMEVVQFDRLQQDVQDVHIFFNLGVDEFAPEQDEKLHQVLIALRKLEDVASVLNRSYHVEVSGYTDPSGAESVNQILRVARANRVIDYFVANGISRERFKPVAESHRLLTESTALGSDSQFGRRVSFRVVVQEGKAE